MEQNTSNLFELQIDHQSQAYLRETAKWAKFLAIVGFVVCALVVIVGIFFGALMSSMSNEFGGGSGMMGGFGIIGAVIYILIALLYFFPCLYLFRFSTRMQVALNNNDQQSLTTAFMNLKSCYKFLGILTLVVLVIYALGLVFGVLGAAMGGLGR